jgi:AraC-like DNA-binding protein
MGIDPFSDILTLTNAEPILTGGLRAGGRWAVRFPARDRITFLLIVKGECWGYFDGEEPVHFATGDIGLLAVPRTFVLCSDPGVPPVDATTLFTLGRTKVQLGDGEDFAYLGGHVMLDPLRGRLVMDVMPPWMHIQASSPQANILRWLVDQLAAEQAAEQPGAQLASAQLTQLLFIQILRAHLKSADLIPVGWLRALADSRLAPALRLMHDDPGRDWHLDELAKASAMSRTTFALHFRTAAGVAPLTYLTGWRMRLAERALRDETTPVAVVARTLGYSSESAFSNAFKRETGKSPSAYRNDLKTSTR